MQSSHRAAEGGPIRHVIRLDLRQTDTHTYNNYRYIDIDNNIYIYIYNILPVCICIHVKNVKKQNVYM